MQDVRETKKDDDHDHDHDDGESSWKKRWSFLDDDDDDDDATMRRRLCLGNLRVGSTPLHHDAFKR